MAIAEQAPGLILDEVMLDGAVAQARLATVLAGPTLIWIGDVAVAERRERLRGDRLAGLLVRSETAFMTASSTTTS